MAATLTSPASSGDDITSLIPKKAPRARPLFDPPIVKRAVVDSLLKLNPRLMMKNPVMFVVEAGAAMTTILAVRDLAAGTGVGGFTFQITLWLWFRAIR
jgi:potassium-transporting ATPase ATP-binding subunit